MARNKPPDSWWCDRCRTEWRGTYRWMHGCCPQPRPDGRDITGHGNRCASILMHVSGTELRHLK